MLLVPLQIRPFLPHSMIPWKFEGNSMITLVARLLQFRWVWLV